MPKSQSIAALLHAARAFQHGNSTGTVPGTGYGKMFDLIWYQKMPESFAKKYYY